MCGVTTAGLLNAPREASRPPASLFQWLSSDPNLCGRVIDIEPIRSEHREFSWWRVFWVTILAIGLISISLVAAIVFLLLGLLFHRRGGGWGGWGLLLFNRFRGEKLHQTRAIYIRASDGEEYAVIEKGKRLGAGVQPSHEVALWGQFRNGVLWLRRGYNITTGSYFGPR